MPLTTETAALVATQFDAKNLTATIPSGASLSGAIDLDGVQLLGIALPSAWTAANLSFQVSVDGGTTWVDAYDDLGQEIIIPANASRYIVMQATRLLAIRWLKVRSGSASAPVNQAAARTLILRGRVV